MGPITKKINEQLLTEGLPKEVIVFLEQLKTEVEPIERQVINDSYHQGYTDKEMNRRAVWDHYQNKYGCYISDILKRNPK